MNYKIRIQEKNYDIQIGEMHHDHTQVIVDGEIFDVKFDRVISGQVQTMPAPVVETKLAAPAAGPTLKAPAASTGKAAASNGVIQAPIPGLMLEIKVRVGEPVKAGQVVAIMEAMKMANDITSPVSGIVREIRATKGAEVSTGDVLIIVN